MGEYSRYLYTELAQTPPIYLTKIDNQFFVSYVNLNQRKRCKFSVKGPLNTIKTAILSKTVIMFYLFYKHGVLYF